MYTHLPHPLPPKKFPIIPNDCFSLKTEKDNTANLSLNKIILTQYIKIVGIRITTSLWTDGT